MNFSGFNFDKLYSTYLYTGIFFDEDTRRRIIQSYGIVHPNIYVDHVTLCYKPSKEEIASTETWNGRTISVQPVSYVADSKGQALVVNLWQPWDRCPNRSAKSHITISCADGISPSYSNELIQHQYGAYNVSPYNIYKGVIGGCSYADIYTLPDSMWNRRGLDKK